MKVLVSLVAVGGLFLIGMLGAKPGANWVFGVVIPYVAVAVFIVGVVYRVLGWAGSAVPFRIPTTCGQQKSLSWIKQETLANPHNKLSVIGRMALEVLFFRSLLRNTKSELLDGPRLVYATDLTLWIAAMAMHWSLLIILIRHIRLLTDPVPFFVTSVAWADGFMEVGLPVFYATSVLFLGGLFFLLVRRLGSSQLRYISLAGDYFWLFMLLGIGVSGFTLRHLVRTDITGIKELAMGWTSFAPVVPESISPLFYGHLTLVCVLLMFLPFGKLMHMAGVFLSPTRNLASNNRRVRHVNPWDYPVKVHSYAEYEDDLRDKMKTAGIPVERQ